MPVSSRSTIPGAAIGLLQRAAGNRATYHIVQKRRVGPAVAPEVESYLAGRPSGQPLGASTRAYFEPRFGTDLSAVRLHTDAAAVGSAAVLEARAYTVGPDVFFGASEYAPDTSDGRKLLAHELTHVVQQGAAPPSVRPERISRSASVTCTAGTHGAPANAAALIDAIEMMSGLTIVSVTSSLTMLQMDILLPGLGAGGGHTMPTTQRLIDYRNSWGLPPAVSSGTRFRDRLGGRTYPSQAEALYHEIDGLQARYTRLSNRLLGNRLHYRCIGGRTTVSGCTGHCTGRDATGCFNTDLIMVCPNFWNFTMGQLAILLIHEAAHRVFGVDHGRNFRHANCYATYAAASQGQTWPGGPACVP